jgi:hypothetical protein
MTAWHSRRRRFMKLSREGAVLVMICVLDLATTIWFVSCHGAAEANPLMRRFLEMGLAAFILAKGALSFGPLAMIEWARRRHPHFVIRALRAGIALYIGFYGLGVWNINRQSSDFDFTTAEMVAIHEEAGKAPTQEQLNEFRIRVARKQID